MKASEIVEKYIAFFKVRGHIQIANSPLVPDNDPTTLFTSSGMQPLVPYLLGESHPQGKRLVNVQNCFRAQDIDEVGDNRHTTFFRMLGNWSLGEYFKEDQLTWFFNFLVNELKLDGTRLFVTVFKGYDNIPKDTESELIWKSQFNTVLGDFAKNGINNITVNEDPEKGIDETDRIFYYGVEKNWWSRSGTPDKMPAGEPGGPDSEVFFDFGKDLKLHEKSQFKDKPCHPNCDCGRFLEIGNSVFMEYVKREDGLFKPLSKRNVDFGGGLERLLMVVENKIDIFETSLFSPIIKSIEETTSNAYSDFMPQMRVVADHFAGAVFMSSDGVRPSNKEQGYILRRLIRRSLDHFKKLEGNDIGPIIEAIVDQYKGTDPILVERFETIKNTILEEQKVYAMVVNNAKHFLDETEVLEEKYQTLQPFSIAELGKENKLSMQTSEWVKTIKADDAFKVYTSQGLSPVQIKSLGYDFDDKAFAELMKQHQTVSRAGVEKKFKGGLADHSEQTIKGHTATHLLHQALRDVLGDAVHQTGSNITTERVRFDFSYDRKLTEEEIKKVEVIVNEKIKEDLPVYFKMLPIGEARKLGAIGLFNEKYQDMVKVYYVGGSQDSLKDAYSKEFCGGPHIASTGALSEFSIQKEEGLGKGFRRIYAIVK